MLTRIEIDGFKTFKDFALDVPPFLVVLGQNAAGKSNLFDAIAFLSRLAQGATAMQAVREARGDLTELLHRDSTGRRVDQMRFAVELALADPDAHVRYELELGLETEDPADPQGTASLVVRDERLRSRPDGSRHGGNWEDAGYEPMPEFNLHAPLAPYPAELILRQGEFSVEEFSSERLRRGLLEDLAAWRVLALEPSALRQPDSYDDDDMLAPSGAHLPNTLARMSRRTRTEDRPEGVLNDVKNDLATVIPEVVDLRVIDVKELRTRTLAVTTKGEGEFTAPTVSDGTLRALALVTAVNDPDDRGLLCVEEPENGVFPQRLDRLMDLLRGAVDARRARQVIVSSHSPAVLNAMPAATGQATRDDVVLLTTSSRVLPEPGAYRRVTVARPLRGDPSLPLPPDLPGPVMSVAEIDRFLGLPAVT